MKELYFVRHGQTDYNKKRIVQGRGVDSALNEIGQEQARLLYDHYQHVSFDHIYASALRRTHQTVSAFAHSEDHMTRTALIDEICWGIHEGQPSSPEQHERYVSMVNAWSSGDYEYHLPGAESAQQLADRCQQFINELALAPYQRVLICTHGRTMRCIACLLTGQPLSKMEQYSVKNTGVSIFRGDSTKYDVVLFNDRSHLGEK